MLTIISIKETLPAFNVFLIDVVSSGPLIFEAYEETYFTLALGGDERLIWISKDFGFQKILNFKRFWISKDFKPKCCC